MKSILLFALLSMFSFAYADTSAVENKNIAFVKEMTRLFYEKRDINQFDKYFSKDLVVDMNGKKFQYQEFKIFETTSFDTLKSVSTTTHDIFAVSNKVVVRMLITLTYQNGKQEKYEDIFVALIQDEKILRLWEVYVDAT